WHWTQRAEGHRRTARRLAVDRSARRSSAHLRQAGQAPCRCGAAEAPALMPLLVDAGVLYAMVDRTDAWHAPIVEYLKGFHSILLAPVTVLPEAAYLVRTRLGITEELKLIEGFVNGGVGIEPRKGTDLNRAHELMVKYPQLGFTDS